MDIREFALERFFARHEFSVAHTLSASDCESLSVRDLLALADPETLGLWNSLRLGYTETQGHPLLRAEVAALYDGVSADEVLIAAPEEGIFLAMNALLAAGDHVVATFPGYQSLYELPRAVGCGVTRWTLVESGGRWTVDLGELEQALRPNTRLLVVNFPHNPTGHLPSPAEFRVILDLAAERGIHVFSDEMYRFLEGDAGRRLPAACDASDAGISLGGLSKAFGLPGLRIGWLATRDRDLLDRLRALKDYTTICSSAPSEILAIMALRARERIIARNVATIRENRAAADAFFGRHADRFVWTPPEAGPVAFPRLMGPAPVADWCDSVRREAGVLIVPGDLFDYPGNHFRIGLGRSSFPKALSLVESHLAGIGA